MWGERADKGIRGRCLGVASKNAGVPLSKRSPGEDFSKGGKRKVFWRGRAVRVEEPKQATPTPSGSTGRTNSGERGQ